MTEDFTEAQAMDRQNSKLPNFEILDCTIRDGGYLNNWQFDKKMVREIYRALSKSGVDYVELGFRSSEKDLDPARLGPWRFTSDRDLEGATSGIKGAKIAIMGDYGKLRLEDIALKKNSLAEMVRVASHKNDIFNAISLLEKVKSKGYKTSLQAMGFTSYTQKEIHDLSRALKNSGLDYFYVADSYGSIFPNEIRAIFEPFLELGTIKIGFHPHNNLQMAFANALEAAKTGVDIIDCSIYGMGRGAGNLPTEILLLYLELLGNRKYNVIPVLNCIDGYFLSIKKRFEWGYQLPFMLSGMYKCHPNYAKKLIEYCEYTIEDISKAMEFINRQNPIGFSQTILKELIEEGVIGSLKTESRKKPVRRIDYKRVKVPYIDRHKERDFLILANGPTLKDYKNKIDEFIKEVDPIIMGANNLSSLYIPDYHAFNNKRRFMMYADTVADQSRLLLSQHFPEEFIYEYTPRDDYEKIYYQDVLDADFNIVNGVIQTNCRTISVLLIGVAIIMGARRIFVAGMDGYLNYTPGGKLLYYDEENEKTDKEMIIERHRWCQKFLDQINNLLLKKGHEGIHIITPTTYKAFYKGIENYIEVSA